MKFLFAQGEVLGANTSEPVIRALRAKGHEAVAFTTKEMAAYQAWVNRGIEPETPEDHGFSRLRVDEMCVCLGPKLPDAIIAGVCEVDAERGEPAKLALEAGDLYGLPTVLLLGVWPHLWLNKHGKRDLDLYRGVTQIFAFDEISRQEFLRQGFYSDQVVITGNPDNDSLGRLKKTGSPVREQFGIGGEEVFTFAVSGNDPTLLLPEDHPHYLGFQEIEALEDFLVLTRRLSSRAIVRIKPGFDRTHVKAAVEKFNPEALILGEEWKNGREVVLASSVVMGTTTTVLQEANFLGVLPISYLPKLTKPNPQIANQLGVVYTITSKRDLEAFMAGPREYHHQSVKWVEVQPNSTEQVVRELEKFA